MRRAHWKMIAGASAFGVLRILCDWNKFGGWNSVERAFYISTWVFCFWMLPLIALRLPAKHRLMGYLLLGCTFLQLILFCVDIFTGNHGRAWLWLVGSGFAGFGAFIFLLDQDVRRFRTERLQSSGPA